jgi:hypothetical protein
VGVPSGEIWIKYVNELGVYLRSTGRVSQSRLPVKGLMDRGSGGDGSGSGRIA